MFSYRRDAILGEYNDRQFNDVYVGLIDSPELLLDKKDVECVEAVPFEKFQEMVDNPVFYKLAPVYGDSCKDVVYFMKNNFLIRHNKGSSQKVLSRI